MKGQEASPAFTVFSASYSSPCRAPSPEWPSLKSSSKDPATPGSAASACLPLLHGQA